MGSLFEVRPSRHEVVDAKADGLLRESATWWIKYRDALGVLRRKSTDTEKETEAKRILRRKEGAAEFGKVEAPRADRITVAQLDEDVKAERTGRSTGS